MIALVVRRHRAPVQPGCRLSRARSGGSPHRASRRDRSSRLPTRRSSRRAWSRIDARSSSRSASGSGSAEHLACRVDRSQRRAQVVTHRPQHRGLQLDLGRLPPCVRRERAHAHGDDEVDGERDPVLRLGEMERMGWRQEEPVEGQHADHETRRPRSGGPRSPPPGRLRAGRARQDRGTGAIGSSAYSDACDDGDGRGARRRPRRGDGCA